MLWTPTKELWSIVAILCRSQNAPHFPAASQCILVKAAKIRGRNKWTRARSLLQRRWTNNCNHNPESNCLMGRVSILFSRASVHLGALPHSLLSCNTILHHVYLISKWRCGAFTVFTMCSAFWGVLGVQQDGLTDSKQLVISSLFVHQLAELVLCISSIAAGISYTNRIKREVPIPRQLESHRWSCFDYSR